MCSLDFFKHFLFNEREHKVAILWKEDEPLFRADEIGKILEMGNIRSSIANFDADEMGVHTMDTLGGNQQVTFLTESGLYRLLFQSRKKIARPFQKWVCDVIKKIRKEGKYELEGLKEHYETQIKEIAHEYKEKLSSADHNGLIDAFSNKYVVYIGVVKHVGDKVLIKIGSTKSLRSRAISLVDEFGAMRFIKVVECEANGQCENFMHHHEHISRFAYHEIVHNGHKSNECFLMSQEDVDKTCRILHHNAFKFRVSQTATNAHLQELKIKQLQNEVSRIAMALGEDKNQQEHPQADATVIATDTRRHTCVRGDKVQRYSADGAQLLGTYVSLIAPTRDPQLKSPTQAGIMKAIREKKVYKEHRWVYLERNLPDDTVQNIGCTIESTQARIGYVAMLNLQKTEVVRVFADQKAAAEDRQFVGGAPISKSIRCGTTSGGHYFQMWCDVDEKLKEAYLQQNALPTKRPSPKAKRYQRLHPVTKECIEVHDSVQDIVRRFKCSRRTLFNAVQGGYLLKGYFFESE